MDLFDFAGHFTVSIRGELRPGHAFHVSRPFVPVTRPRSLHDHEFFEVFWIAAGSCSHYCNGAVELLPTGTICFVRPNDVHAFQAIGSTPCRMVNIAFASETALHLSERYGDEVAGRFFWSKSAMPHTLQLDDQRLRELSLLDRRLDETTGSLARLEGFLLYLIGDLCGTSSAISSDVPKWLIRACETIRSREALVNGVPALVDACGRSHAHVSRSFQRYFGQTPSSYVNALRMDLAARRLVETDSPILEIALDCGIDDPSHFYRLFRQTHGQSPKRYRQRARLDLVNPVGPTGTAMSSLMANT